MIQKPIRLRDFVEDRDGWIYAVSTYDNQEKAGCLLRYVPDPNGERVNPEGIRFRKLDFSEAFDLITREKPEYLDVVHRIPLSDIRRVYKPEEEIGAIRARESKIGKLIDLFGLPDRTIGCTGSFLCGLANELSDIDLVVYGKAWFRAQELLRSATLNGDLPPIDSGTWQKIYAKRNPELSFREFLVHEKRKWNRGQIDSTYFDLLFTRSYEELDSLSLSKGENLGVITLEAVVTDATLAYDSPAVYVVDHEEIAKILSFTHTYSGQALSGEWIQARGVCEQHDGERWLIVGTTREA
ncbi:MAG: nucleotidyltransferase domain-containing protein, partial [Methanolinea sp.]|nr:nucleotidyltransferase domain-containing protein [Methanolinea sp.]